ncbi:MAG: hypothetical protein HQL75_08580 [Magnetococcales bacterium]|nr:hypothetical protein [Magnetococcales bacterium]
MSSLNELELDLLTEAFNIGLGMGSAVLSELLGEEVLLTVPSLNILPKRPAIDECGLRFGTEAHTIRQTFLDAKNVSALSGDAFLFVPETSSQAVTELLSGSEVSEVDVLSELGNLILHSCLASLADMMETELDSQIPEVHIHRTADVLIGIAREKNKIADCGDGLGTSKRVDSRRPPHLQDKVLQLDVRFKTSTGEITGEVMLFLDLAKLPDLKVYIRDAIHRLTVT